MNEQADNEEPVQPIEDDNLILAAPMIDDFTPYGTVEPLC